MVMAWGIRLKKAFLLLVFIANENGFCIYTNTSTGHRYMARIILQLLRKPFFELMDSSTLFIY